MQPAHEVIEEYDQRADCENLIGEAKREGLEAIPSRKFGNNYAYFQIVMLAYNIWRSFKMLAAHGMRETERPDCENNSSSVWLDVNFVSCAGKFSKNRLATGGRCPLRVQDSVIINHKQ
jgi:hypothetical protein